MLNSNENNLAGVVMYFKNDRFDIIGKEFPKFKNQSIYCVKLSFPVSIVILGVQHCVVEFVREIYEYVTKTDKGKLLANIIIIRHVNI